MTASAALGRHVCILRGCSTPSMDQATSKQSSIFPRISNRDFLSTLARNGHQGPVSGSGSVQLAQPARRFAPRRSSPLLNSLAAANLRGITMHVAENYENSVPFAPGHRIYDVMLNQGSSA
jgi:hypothetical protein